MKKVLAAGLASSALAGFAVMWSPGRWAVCIPQVAIFALSSMWALDTMARGRNPHAGFPVLPLLGILVCGLAQLAFHWTAYRWDTVESILYWFTNLLALVVAADLSGDNAIRSNLMDWLFFPAVALAILSVIQYFTSDGRVFWIFAAPYREDVYGPFVYKNQFAAFLELLLPIALVQALGDSRRRGYQVTTAVLYACMVASNSRAGLIVATCEIVVISSILLAKKAVSPKQLGQILGGVVMLAGVFVAVVGPENMWTRFEQHDPYLLRRELLTASAAMFRDHPIRGFGLGTWPTVYPGYAVADFGLFANQAHNDWAQMGVEAGIPGVLCMAAFFAWSLRAGWRSVWGIGIPSVLIHAVVDYPIQRQALAVFLFVLAGIELGAPKRELQKFRNDLK